MSLFEHFFKGMSLYFEARISIRIRIRIRVKSQIPIRIRIKVMRIHNTDSKPGSKLSTSFRIRPLKKYKKNKILVNIKGPQQN